MTRNTKVRNSKGVTVVKNMDGTTTSYGKVEHTDPPMTTHDKLYSKIGKMRAK